jgi:hypothetical protein
VIKEDHKLLHIENGQTTNKSIVDVQPWFNAWTMTNLSPAEREYVMDCMKAEFGEMLDTIKYFEGQFKIQEPSGSRSVSWGI